MSHIPYLVRFQISVPGPLMAYEESQSQQPQGCLLPLAPIETHCQGCLGLYQHCHCLAHGTLPDPAAYVHACSMAWTFPVNSFSTVNMPHMKSVVKLCTAALRLHVIHHSRNGFVNVKANILLNQAHILPGA